MNTVAGLLTRRRRAQRRDGMHAYRSPGLLLALALASCDTTAVPRPRLPQVEQATEALQGGGERYRVHRTCTSAAKSVDELVRCMRDAGFDFVARGPGYQETDCWQARDRGELDRLVPLCFVRGPEPASGVAR